MTIPKQFLKTLKRTGLANALFFTSHKYAGTYFVLNREPHTLAKIFFCGGKNFGCGSSYEHAPCGL